MRIQSGKRWLVVVAIALPVIAAACGGAGGHAGHEMGCGAGDAGTVPGEAVEESDADRTIEVTASDRLSNPTTSTCAPARP